MFVTGWIMFDRIDFLVRSWKVWKRTRPGR